MAGGCFIADGVCQGCRSHTGTALESVLTYVHVVVNYVEMVRADVEKLINDNVIHGIKNKSAFL